MFEILLSLLSIPIAKKRMKTKNILSAVNATNSWYLKTSSKHSQFSRRVHKILNYCIPDRRAVSMIVWSTIFSFIKIQYLPFFHCINAALCVLFLNHNRITNYIHISITEKGVLQNVKRKKD